MTVRWIFTASVVLQYGTFHFVGKDEWKRFINKAKNNTNISVLNIFRIFTNKVPVSYDIAAFVKGLADEGELESMYRDCQIISTTSYVSDLQAGRNASRRKKAR